MDAGHAMRLMDAAEHGSIVWLPDQPQSFQFHYFAESTGRRYKLILKVVSGRPEVWLSTFLFSDERTFRAAKKKGKLLKE